MDYNYVRMRKALKDGDLAKADEYKLLYEAGKVKKRVSIGVQQSKTTVTIATFFVIIAQLC